jgi:hypothetical protein
MLNYLALQNLLDGATPEDEIISITFHWLRNQTLSKNGFDW